MSIFTAAIIIWTIYKFITSIIKKNNTQEIPGKLSDFGIWREQLKQALENGSNQAGSLKSVKPKELGETKDYVATEGTQGNKGTQETLETERTSDYVGILGSEAYKSTEYTPSREMDRNGSALSGIQLTLTERDLVQGVIWAEILGKPRARHPFRGPRA